MLRGGPVCAHPERRRGTHQVQHKGVERLGHRGVQEQEYELGEGWVSIAAGWGAEAGACTLAGREGGPGLRSGWQTGVSCSPGGGGVAVSGNDPRQAPACEESVRRTLRAI